MEPNKYNIEIFSFLKLPKIFEDNYIWKFDKNLLSPSHRVQYSSESDKIYTRVLNGSLIGIRLDIDEK